MSGTADIGQLNEALQNKFDLMGGNSNASLPRIPIIRSDGPSGQNAAEAANGSLESAREPPPRYPAHEARGPARGALVSWSAIVLWSFVVLFGTILFALSPLKPTQASRIMKLDLSNGLESDKKQYRAPNGVVVSVFPPRQDDADLKPCIESPTYMIGNMFQSNFVTWDQFHLFRKPKDTIESWYWLGGGYSPHDQIGAAGWIEMSFPKPLIIAAIYIDAVPYTPPGEFKGGKQGRSGLKRYSISGFQSDGVVKTELVHEYDVQPQSNSFVRKGAGTLHKTNQHERQDKIRVDFVACDDCHRSIFALTIFINAVEESDIVLASGTPVPSVMKGTSE